MKKTLSAVFTFLVILSIFSAPVYAADSQPVLNKNISFSMTLGQTAATINGRTLKLSTAPSIVDGEIFLAVNDLLYFLPEACSYHVQQKKLTIGDTNWVYQQQAIEKLDFVRQFAKATWEIKGETISGWIVGDYTNFVPTTASELKILGNTKQTSKFLWNSVQLSSDWNMPKNITGFVNKQLASGLISKGTQVDLFFTNDYTNFIPSNREELKELQFPVSNLTLEGDFGAIVEPVSTWTKPANTKDLSFEVHYNSDKDQAAGNKIASKFTCWIQSTTSTGSVENNTDSVYENNTAQHKNLDLSTISFKKADTSYSWISTSKVAAGWYIVPKNAGIAQVDSFNPSTKSVQQAKPGDSVYIHESFTVHFGKKQANVGK